LGSIFDEAEPADLIRETGVLIDSEPLWRKAMIEGFASIGVLITEEDCKKTTGNRLKEVVEYWFEKLDILDFLPTEIEHRIINMLVKLINKEGKAISGVIEVINFCNNKNIKIGLATSSSNQLMEAVLEKLKLKNTFKSSISAENLEYGKPHPEVFLICASQLQISPLECIVIEDSINGVIAAKAAYMRVIALPEQENINNHKFSIADYKLNNMQEVLKLFKTIIK
jgi:sugar-phosphatase